MLERERIRTRLYQQQKSTIPEERERKNNYTQANIGRKKNNSSEIN